MSDYIGVQLAKTIESEKTDQELVIKTDNLGDGKIKIENDLHHLSFKLDPEKIVSLRDFFSKAVEELANDKYS